MTLKLNQDVVALLQPLRQLLSERLDEIWLVGGTIRDLLEEQPPKDFDFGFVGDLTPQIRRWAAGQGGHWFWLDKPRNQSRVLFTTQGLQFDFAPLRAADIAADLRLRDYTLNAMALPFVDLQHPEQNLIDPLNGRQDLAAGLLRSCGPGVLSDDPLRVLKGIRHHALRGWQFEELTASQLSQAAPLLLTVAGERLRNELSQIMEAPHLISAVGLMNKFGILDCLFPGRVKETLADELLMLRARIEQLSQIPCFSGLLAQSLEEGLTLRSLLCLSVLVQGGDSLLMVTQISQRLRLSTRSRSILQSIQRETVDFKRVMDSDSPRVAALKLEALGQNCVEQILFALARQPRQNRDLLFAEQVTAYLKQLERGRIPDLLNGREISRLTGLPQGQHIGDYQRQIKKSEIAGEISDAISAASWLKRQISD